MSAQQAQFAETIRAMKLAMKRRANGAWQTSTPHSQASILTDADYESDSESSLHASTNRGNKLRRHARYVRQGQLDDTGRLAYRRKITHAGYTRTIIARNPPLYDQDGDLADSENEKGDAEPIHDNPFSGVELHNLLRPLTAASELAEHPSLSVAYKSKALTQMAEEAEEMLRREREVLWKAKRLLRRLRGDADWVPCEAFETEVDEGLLFEGVGDTGADMEDHEAETENGNGNGGVSGDGDMEMSGVEAMDMALQQAADEQAAETGVDKEDLVETTAGDNEEPTAESNGHAIPPADHLEPPAQDPTTLQNPSIDSLRPSNDPEANSEQTSNSERHAMTTRAGARARSPPPSSPTPSDSASITSISPWFLIPPTSLPDRDLGLPSTEAEEARRALLLYVQKQENIVRSLENLSSGLLRADRLRQSIYRASKAEAHVKDDGKGRVVTAMSDGEDWYDVEEWGLGRGELKMLKDGTWGLEKGKDEVEDLGEEGEGRRGGRRRNRARM